MILMKDILNAGVTDDERHGHASMGTRRTVKVYVCVQGHLVALHLAKGHATAREQLEPQSRSLRRSRDSLWQVGSGILWCRKRCKGER